MRNVKPILMNAAMVQATLREIENPGTGKTQTRRIIKPQPVDTGVSWQFDLKDKRSACFSNFPYEKFNGREFGVVEYCPYGKPGGLLWVRESIRYSAEASNFYFCDKGVGTERYLRLLNEGGKKSRPSIHMPRWASRITLEVTDVRVQRLQDISEADVWAEGIVETDAYASALHSAEPVDLKQCFSTLWTSINGPESWEANPWVWAVTFQPYLINVDAFVKEMAAA
tara:strand:- start:57 stop:734 length:678 start_codon:yes stop_codon:yes gene_type:complete